MQEVSSVSFVDSRMQCTAHATLTPFLEIFQPLQYNKLVNNWVDYTYQWKRRAARWDTTTEESESNRVKPSDFILVDLTVKRL